MTHRRDIPADDSSPPRPGGGEPFVSVILPVHRPDEPAALALHSARAQTVRRVEILPVGCGAAELVRREAPRDGRIRPLDCPGATAEALAFAAGVARGRWVAFLRPPAVWHEVHLERLLDALRAHPGGCRAAYGDVYHTVFRLRGGRREVLAKLAPCRRDFDRFSLLHCDYVPLSSLLADRSLLERIGPPPAGVDGLAGWDLARRLACFADLLHVPVATAERYVPHDAPPKAVDPAEAGRVVAARPPKPWPKMADLSILHAPEDGADPAGTVRRLLRGLRVPFRLYLAAPAAPGVEADERVVHVPVGPSWPWDARIDKALRACEGDCVAILPPTGRAPAAGITRAFFALLHGAARGEAILPAGPQRGPWSVLARRADLLRARHAWPALPIRRALEADGVRMRPPRPEERPFALERALRAGRALAAEGDFRQAARHYQALARAHGCEALLAEAAAEALFHEGRRDRRAIELCRRANAAGATVSALLLEGRLLKRNQRIPEALDRLRRAREILDRQPERKASPC